MIEIIGIALERQDESPTRPADLPMNRLSGRERRRLARPVLFAFALFLAQLLILIHSVDHVSSPPTTGACPICVLGHVDKAVAGPVLVLSAPRFEPSDPFAEPPADLVARPTHCSFPRGPPSNSLL